MSAPTVQVKPNPPATPSDPAKALVNKAAQAQFQALGALMDKRCEDYETGTPLPCNDAGIAGMGGNSSPCRIFTPDEARARLWPAPAVTALERFINNGGGEV